MIINDGMRARSEVTIEEASKSLASEIAILTEEEMALLNAIKTDRDLRDMLLEEEFVSPPVDMETFLMDEYFCGAIGKGLYPKLIDDLIELFSGDYNEAIFTGSVGYGKSTISHIGMLRMLYEVSCLRDPQRSYGLSEGSQIVFSSISITKLVAREVVFGGVVEKLRKVPYFMEEFYPEIYSDEVRFPNNILVAPATSTDSGIIGYNIFGGIIDELNFMHRPKMSGRAVSQAAKLYWSDYDKASKVYSAIKRRMESRFMNQGKLPGVLFLIGSKRTNLDFTEKRVRDAADDPKIFVRDYCLSGETKIKTDSGEASISGLVGKKSVKVFSVNLKNGKIEPSLGVRVRKTIENAAIYKVVFEDDTSVRCTLGHPFLVRGRKYKMAKDLLPGDVVECGVGSAGEVYTKSISQKQVARIMLDGNGSVYDMAVPGHNNFVLANGAVVHNSMWDPKPEGTYSSKKFKVFVSASGYAHKILAEGEEEQQKSKEGRIIEVPADFRDSFERDLYNSLRDIAGIATDSVLPFITQRDKIIEMFDKSREHPFSVLEYEAGSSGGEFLWDRLVTRTKDGGYVPAINPGASRYVHIDPSITGDATAICVAHIAKRVDVMRTRGDLKYQEVAPFIVVDFILRIIPPKGEEIQFADVRSLVYDLTAHGFPIRFISLDSFQSRDSLQIYREKGYKSDVVSVDTTPEPYDALRNAIYENRINCYEYPPLAFELRHLEKDNVKGKVDHKQGHGKDVSDALAGVVYALTTRADLGSVVVEKGMSVYDKQVGSMDGEDDTWVLKKNQIPVDEEHSERLPVPFMR